MKKRALKQIIAVVLLICFLVHGTAYETDAADLPGLNAKPTRKNVLTLLKKYDKEGAFLLSSQYDGIDYMVWLQGSRQIGDRLATAVHEQCHLYCRHVRSDQFFNTGASGEVIYIGNKKTILIPYTDTFYSEEMGKTIPKRLRNFYFDTYIKKGVNSYANGAGIYGLMNEFCAYSWGMNNTISMFNYYKRFKPTKDTWKPFLSNACSDHLAYVVFKYYILNYLYYAKQHYPEVYTGIMQNENFRRAYRITEKRYAKLARKYDSDLKKIVKLAKKKGLSARIKGDYLWIGNKGIGIFAKQYNVFKKELSKSRYQTIHKQLVRQ